MSETGSGWSVGNSCDPVTAGGQDWKPSGNSFCREHFGTWDIVLVIWLIMWSIAIWEVICENLVVPDPSIYRLFVLRLLVSLCKKIVFFLSWSTTTSFLLHTTSTCVLSVCTFCTFYSIYSPSSLSSSPPVFLSTRPGIEPRPVLSILLATPLYLSTPPSSSSGTPGGTCIC